MIAEGRCVTEIVRRIRTVAQKDTGQKRCGPRAFLL
jgi:hypothetical protein